MFYFLLHNYFYIKIYKFYLYFVGSCSRQYIIDKVAYFLHIVFHDRWEVLNISFDYLRVKASYMSEHI